MTIEHEFQDDFTGEPSVDLNAAPAENPLLLVHRAFRGRYLWALLLGVAIMAPASIIGYVAIPPKYTSTGIIEVRPIIDRILHDVQENQLMPMFDSYVETQANFMVTQRVLAMAVDSQEMRDAGWERGLDGMEELHDSLKVGRQRGGRLIFVNCEHEDPGVATIATQAVMQSYMLLHGDRTAATVEDRYQHLEALRIEFNLQRKNVTDQLLAEAKPWGTYNLESILAKVVDDMGKVDENIPILRSRIALFERRAEALGDRNGEPLDIDALDALMEEDEEFRRRMEDLELTERAIDLLGQDHGPGHREMKRLALQRDAFRDRVDERLAELKAELTGVGPDGVAIGVGKTIEQLRLVLDDHRSRLMDLSERAREIGNAKLKLDRLKSDEEALVERMSITNERLDALRTEMQNIRRGRIQIVQNAEQTHTPSSDQRTMLAVAGALGGFGFGVGFIGLTGFMRRSYQYLDELEHLGRGTPLLGTLPDLEAEDTESEQIAALAVHHIRNMLHVASPSNDETGRIFTITSASAGEGKTSLSLALGMSFAVAGQRTLLLDADLVGGGLTSQFGLSPQLGLTDAINNGDDLTPYLFDSPATNLWILPTGSNANFDPEQLSEQSVRRVLGRLREQFDTILVDTGPILGSLEADIVSALADRVIVTVSRGQARRLVEASLSRLRHLGATPAGVVFNRATAEDIHNSVSHISMQSTSTRALPDGSGRHARKPLVPLAAALGDKRFAIEAMDAAHHSDDHDPVREQP